MLLDVVITRLLKLCRLFDVVTAKLLKLCRLFDVVIDKLLRFPITMFTATKFVWVVFEKEISNALRTLDNIDICPSTAVLVLFREFERVLTVCRRRYVSHEPIYL
jgi:hypothetical protein